MAPDTINVAVAIQASFMTPGRERFGKGSHAFSKKIFMASSHWVRDLNLSYWRLAPGYPRGVTIQPSSARLLLFPIKTKVSMSTDSGSKRSRLVI